MLGIDIIKRLGGGAGAVTLQDAAVVGTRNAMWWINSDGFTYKRTTAGAFVKQIAWINPQSGMDQYEVRATVSSGDVPPGTIGSWISIDIGSVWGWANSLVEKSCALLIEIRTVVGHVTVDSATITLFVAGIE